MSDDHVTALLNRWIDGSVGNNEELGAVIHSELRRIAAAYMRRERPEHTLQPTALVNEAFLRLMGGRAARWEHRAHFFGVAARLMRQILVDHARRRRVEKRGPHARRILATKIAVPSSSHDIDILALHEALSELAALDSRQVEIVELRYFGGLTESEVATIVGVSPATVRREVAAAKFWLGRRMKSHP